MSTVLVQGTARQATVQATAAPSILRGLQMFVLQREAAIVRPGGVLRPWSQTRRQSPLIVLRRIALATLRFLWLPLSAVLIAFTALVIAPDTRH